MPPAKRESEGALSKDNTLRKGYDSDVTDGWAIGCILNTVRKDNKTVRCT